MPKPMSTLLGFDFGTKKIGIATGQEITQTATPLTTYTYAGKKLDWLYIEQLLQEWKPQALVVGLPFQLNDQESETAPAAKRFARRLHGRFHLDVYMVDERLTSRDAQSQLEAELGRKPKDHLLIDAVAARLILETWLHLDDKQRQKSHIEHISRE